MPPRLHVDLPLAAGASVALPAAAARHVQVLRLQPGQPLVLFDGRGGEWSATVRRIGRRDVDVDVGAHDPVEREAAIRVTLALGMPANDRMDALVEKATELGVAAIQPLLTARSVLRLAGERAARRRDHWHAIAVAASEQSGRTRVPQVAPVRGFADWLAGVDAASRWLLGFDDATPLAALGRPAGDVVVLSGPEGGLSAAEQHAARAAGFATVGLGPRVLRADTAPLAVLGYVTLRW